MRDVWPRTVMAERIPWHIAKERALAEPDYWRTREYEDAWLRQYDLIRQHFGIVPDWQLEATLK